MKIRYRYRIEDFEDICVTAERLVPRVRRMRLASIVLGCVLSVAPFLTSAGLWPPDSFLLGMEPMALCLIVCGFQSTRKRARKMYAAAVTEKEFEAEIGEDGIMTTSAVARGESKWEAFQRVIEGGEAIALVSDAMMYLFPKRAFTSEQLEEFKSLIAARVPVRDGKTRTIRLL